MKLTDRAPVYCSSCFQQKLGVTHVDLEVVWDGPVIDHEGTKYPIDDIIICIDCAQAIAGLLPDQAAHTIALEARVRELQSDLAGSKAYCDRLEAALNAKPELPAPRRRQAAAAASRV